MTLSVYAFWIDPVTAQAGTPAVAPTPPQNELFGFQSCAQDLWGSEAVGRGGASQLHRLKDELPLYFEGGQDIDALERDIRLILAARKELSQETGYDEHFLEFRCLNALEAIRIARLDPNGIGGVTIG